MLTRFDANSVQRQRAKTPKPIKTKKLRQIGTTVSMKLILVVMMLLPFSAIGFAQDLPDAPGVVVGSFSPGPSPSARSSSSVSAQTPPAAKGPFIDPQVADATYWDYTAALVGSTVLNVEMTARCSERGTCLTWIASGSAGGSTRLRLYAYTLPADAALSFLAYKLKGRTRLWILPDALATAANLFSAGRSYGRLQLDPIKPPKK